MRQVQSTIPFAKLLSIYLRQLNIPLHLSLIGTHLCILDFKVSKRPLKDILRHGTPKKADLDRIQPFVKLSLANASTCVAHSVVHRLQQLSFYLDNQAAFL